MDVIDSRPVAAHHRTSTPISTALVVTGALVTLVLVVPDARRGGMDLLDMGDPIHPPGTLTLVLDRGPAVVGRTEGRPWDGVLVLHLDTDTDTDAGPALLQVSGAARAAGLDPTVSHSWGTLQAVVDSRRCSGTFGWRAASGDPYGGGRVDLTCDDGSGLAGELRTYERPPAEDTTASGILDLAPGSSP